MNKIFFFLFIVFFNLENIFSHEVLLKTPAPVIYLENNLDEKDKLGYCIDTVGRGFGKKLHAHSCKPRGGDVQFKYEFEKKKIQSATFEGKCVEVLNNVRDGSILGLLNCSSTSSLQKFDYNFNTKEFTTVSDNNFCLAVDVYSRKAGPFMSRNLRIYKCDKIHEKYKKWLIKN